MNNLKNIIDCMVADYLNESFVTKLQTEYKFIEKNNDGLREYAYEFKTNSGTEYCLEFISAFIGPAILIDGKNQISTITKNLKQYNGDYFCVEIGFTIKSNYGVSSIGDDRYVQNTNKGEPFELLSRISYLVDIYQQKFPNISLYVVSKETDSKKLEIYRTIYRNIFSDQFKMIEGDYMLQDNDKPIGGIFFINYNNLI